MKKTLKWATLAQALLIAWQLCGAVEWNWWVILSPSIAAATVAALIFIVFLLTFVEGDFDDEY